MSARDAVTAAIKAFDFEDYGLHEVDPTSEYAEWVPVLAAAVQAACRPEVLAEAYDAITARAVELSAMAEEELRRDLEETAQEWHSAALVVAKLMTGSAGKDTGDSSQLPAGESTQATGPTQYGIEFRTGGISAVGGNRELAELYLADEQARSDRAVRLVQRTITATEWTAVDGQPVAAEPPVDEPTLAVDDPGMTPGELLRTPKARAYCATAGCGHGDNIHGPFCFAAGCTCTDWRWTEGEVPRA